MAENSYDYPMVLDISDEEDQAFEQNRSARGDPQSKRSSAESDANVPSRGADVGLMCNMVYNPWPMDKEPPEYCNRQGCHHECCRRDYFVGVENENAHHCNGDPIRYARQMFLTKRGPSGSSWANRPRMRKNIREYVVEWDRHIPGTHQNYNLVEEKAEVVNWNRDAKGKGKGKEEESSRKRQRELSVEENVYQPEVCDSPIWSPDSARWENSEVDMRSRFGFFRSN